MKIDICLVTKNDISSIKGIEYIPINKLIVETSKPLALARMKAIKKVTTDIFAFIDDDVEIDENWFNVLIPYIIKKDVGAVQGILSIKGLGIKWDNALRKDKVESRVLKIGDRGFTHNTLIKTDLVRDWIPPKDLSAWEDYDLTTHILKKGYSWIKVSTDSRHNNSFKRVWKNAQWGISGRKKYFPSRKDSFIQIIRKSIWIIRVIFSLKINWYRKIFIVYFNIATIYAHIRWLLKLK